MRAVGIGCHDAGDGAAFQHQLLAAHPEIEIGSGRLGLLAIVALDLRLVAFLGEAGERSRIEPDRPDIGKEVLPLVARIRPTGMGHMGEILVGEPVVVPIDVVRFVLDEAHEKRRVDLISRDGHPVLEVLVHIHMGNRIALGGTIEDLRVDGHALGTRSHVRVFGLTLQKRHPHAAFGQLAASAHASIAMPHHDDVVIVLLDELLHRLRRRAPA